MFEGPQFAVSDSTEGALEQAGNGAGVLRSNGRADFGSDRKLEGSLFLGFESFYSVPGRKELESYGTGLVPDRISCGPGCGQMVTSDRPKTPIFRISIGCNQSVLEIFVEEQRNLSKFDPEVSAK